MDYFARFGFGATVNASGFVKEVIGLLRLCLILAKAHRKEAWLFLETVWKGLEYLCQQVEKEETGARSKIWQELRLH